MPTTPVCRGRQPAARPTSPVGLLLVRLGLAVALLLGLTAYPAVSHPQAAEAAAHPVAAEAASPLELTVGGVSPTIVGAGQTLTITGRVTNTSTEPVRVPAIEAMLSDRTLSRRDEVAAWADGTTPATGTVVATTGVPGVLAPGASRPYRLTIRRAAEQRPGTYGVLPLEVRAADSTLRTFAMYQRRKEYEPLKLTWLVPLTLDPRADLFGTPGAAREAAWEAVLGEGSRLSRLVSATEDTDVTWVVDATLLSPAPVLPGGQPSAGATSGTSAPTPGAGGATGSPSPGPTSSATGSPTPSATGSPLEPAEVTEEQRLRAAFAERLTSRDGPPLVVLPAADADLALAGPLSDLIRAQVADGQRTAEQVGGRGDLAWPADNRLAAVGEPRLRAHFGGQAPSGVIVAQHSLPLGGITPSAGRRTTSGVPLLAFDDSLSAEFAAAATRGGSVAAVQQLLADTLVLMDESPGLDRSVLIAAPRYLEADPAALTAVLRSVGEAGWLAPRSLDGLLADARTALPIGQEESVLVEQTPHATVPPSPVTGRRAAALDKALSDVAGLATVRSDGDAFGTTWGEAARQLTSARWRSASRQWGTLNRSLAASVTQTRKGVRVSPATINFLADSGRVQVTVVNDLPVSVRNLTLTVTSASPVLRVESPPRQLRIGARSRTTVVASVTALAAGEVPLTTTLRAADGTLVSRSAEVSLRVSPTGDWFYWVVGGFSMLILGLGIWRTIRRGRRRDESPATTADPADGAAVPDPDGRSARPLAKAAPTEDLP